jgi:hypothetical protein
MFIAQIGMVSHLFLCARREVWNRAEQSNHRGQNCVAILFPAATLSTNTG